MDEILNKITTQIEKHNNVLLYKQELYEYYKKRDKRYRSTYISTPRKGKNAIETVLKKIDDKTQTKNKTISQLIEEIKEKTKKEKMIIYIDNFEQLTNRELSYYQELENTENIIIIANINQDKKFIDEDFLKNFIILSDDYYTNRSQSINITYTLLLLLSILIFILFLKLQLSIINYLVNTLWFTLLMYRTIYYISR